MSLLVTADEKISGVSPTPLGPGVGGGVEVSFKLPCKMFCLREDRRRTPLRQRVALCGISHKTDTDESFASHNSYFMSNSTGGQRTKAAPSGPPGSELIAAPLWN
ncbi:hypothetical protein EVAR_81597_1 [Eumeta japonica]|uniref:Uncharacterized protein n=1 Tax=Eumeta variegata TaxID=151549 RepID=A0A4C1WFX4_EUMVA|nr:hypothetical protein EVAR_81597_1 [Eumeta japonica]